MKDGLLARSLLADGDEGTHMSSRGEMKMSLKEMIYGQRGIRVVS
jgi:hypothetical protein